MNHIMFCLFCGVLLCLKLQNNYFKEFILECKMVIIKEKCYEFNTNILFWLMEPDLRIYTHACSNLYKDIS